MSDETNHVHEHVHQTDYALIERIAAEAARKAVQDTLTKLGIDHADPLAAQRDFAALREVRQLVESPDYQADLMHLRTWRKSMENVRSKGLLTVVGLLVTGLAAAMWLGIKGLIVGGPG